MRRALLAALLALVSLIACLSGKDERARPVQGWWAESGPVVPHDTFPSDCGLCHTSASWSELRTDFAFDHARETGVALAGAHAHAECLRCHNDRGPVATFTAKGCAGCHEDAHRGELGRDCAKCHDERDWRPDEVFALHSRTRMPLVGAHARTACWACHPGADVGLFRGVDPECAACHLDDYQATTLPDHSALGFPTTCQDCHGVRDWRGASFLHAFPITSGPHARDCAECHSRGETSSFSCTDCHAHAAGEMNHEHDDVGGYVWESRACFGCHPRGRK